ncbi:Na(+)-translocating NADH-quinone reductase subunit A [Alterinioella nitratireducens]|uniref:Na(+)-translocating NADH-quinone reductase subunit A n=1 Tax=Alterinioella nitratireducens TaxID=2735915 RepID=UPI001BE46F0F|nr:Na(+)-translocating NADH-quinone reductase subunit A [Alterinioella nitratireducens]
MAVAISRAGLSPVFPSPPASPDIAEVQTEEAAVRPPVGARLHVTPLVSEGDLVAQGAAVACLRHAPDICFTAPIAGRIARMSLLPGKKLSEVVIFREAGGGVERHATDRADMAGGLRALLQGAGVWPWLRRRPFGGMPAQDETPAAIVVMASDTRPHAPAPQSAVEGRDEDFARGLHALTRMTEGVVIVCGPVAPDLDHDRIRIVPRGGRHPQGSAGICIHQLCPATLDNPVWDIHAEDVAAIGALVETGQLPMTRLVHLAGAALREGRMVRTHPGADLRQLTQHIALPGPHVLMSGSPLDGHVAQWLAPRHRQVTVLPREEAGPRPHWLIAALTRSVIGRPVIPSAALTQAFGGALPAVPFLRALGAGDEETATRLGLLSLLEEDVALADYVLAEGGTLMAQLRALLDRIRTEAAA